MLTATERSEMPLGSTGKNSEGGSRRAGMSRGKAIEIVWPQCVAITISVLYCWIWNPSHPVADAFRGVLSDTAKCGVSGFGDRKSTRLNSSHLGISYAVFC